GLVQRQIRDCLAQPAVLKLKVLQPLHLLGLQPTELLTPPIIRHLAHPDLADCVHHVLALRDQNIDLPQLRDDLFRLVSLPCHCSPPGCQRHTSSRTTSMGVDQVSLSLKNRVMLFRLGGAVKVVMANSLVWSHRCALARAEPSMG